MYFGLLKKGRVPQTTLLQNIQTNHSMANTKVYLALSHHKTVNSCQMLISLWLSAVTGQHGAVVHWSRWRSLVILILATVLTSACAELVTEHIQPILNQPNISQVRTYLLVSQSLCGRFPCSPHVWLFLQYFIGVTVLAMVPEIPEIVNGIQFALQNNISLR